MIRTTAAAVLALTGTALAQPQIVIDVNNPVLLPGQSALVTVRAGYGGTDWAIAGVGTNFVTSVGSTGWSGAHVIRELAGPGTSPGTPSSTGIDGVVAGQYQSPTSQIYADPTNPIAFWQATYTAPLDPAAPFTIDLSTMTSRYEVYIRRDSTLSESRLADLVEGSATIRVIPAPASALVFALGAVALRRRR